MFKIVIVHWTGRQWEIVRALESYDVLSDAWMAQTAYERQIASDDPYWYAGGHRYAIFDTSKSECVEQAV